jgi:hypothetical protein
MRLLTFKVYGGIDEDVKRFVDEIDRAAEKIHDAYPGVAYSVRYQKQEEGLSLHPTGNP